MKISYKYIAPAIIVVSALGIAATASAATSGGSNSSLAQEIAQKFHLNQADVQSVIDQHRDQKQQDHQQRYENRLSTAVSQNKLSASQKQAILDEHNKLINEIKSASGSNRRQVLQQVRQEAKDWASQNNIDVKWLLPVRGFGSASTNS